MGVIAMSVLLSTTVQAQKVVVAHRGASGYLPEHTMPSKAMAYAMGADYIEQDVVMTRDDQLLVFHDITLDRTTDVATRFPDRAREDGHYYVVDFTLEEIRQLKVSEGFSIRQGEPTANYPARFPMWQSAFAIHTLVEEIELIQGLNKSTGRDVGIYPEIKSPAFHHQEGKDLATEILKVLQHYGYTSKDSKVYLQTFEFDELVRVHDELLPAMGIDVKLVLLIGGDEDSAWMLEEQGIEKISKYADGIGPDKSLIISRNSTKGNLQISKLVEYAHANNMQVHPYTFRLDEGQIPSYADSFEQLLDYFYFGAGIDGVFTDFPDRAVQFLRQRQ